MNGHSYFLDTGWLTTVFIYLFCGAGEHGLQFRRRTKRLQRVASSHPSKPKNPFSSLVICWNKKKRTLRLLQIRCCKSSAFARTHPSLGTQFTAPRLFWSVLALISESLENITGIIRVMWGHRMMPNTRYGVSYNRQRPVSRDTIATGH